MSLSYLKGQQLARNLLEARSRQLDAGGPAGSARTYLLSALLLVLGVACSPDASTGIKDSGRGSAGRDAVGDAVVQTGSDAGPDGPAEGPADAATDPASALDSCAGVTCSGHGVCRVSAGSAACICDSGYHRSATASLACEPDASGRLCTEFGHAPYTDYAKVNAFPSGSVLLSTWTHVVDSGPSGNDYPFAVTCGANANIPACMNDFIDCVAGNVGPDESFPGYFYNVNTMSCSGDSDVIYQLCSDAQAHGWVFVAWHIEHGSGTTTIREYLKFGTAGAMQLVSTHTQNVAYSTAGLLVGQGVMAYARTYQMYSRVHEMAAPTVAQVDAIAMNPDADPAAWADWSLVSGDVTDRSGHGRDLAIQGQVYPGIPGPF